MSLPTGPVIGILGDNLRLRGSVLPIPPRRATRWTRGLELPRGGETAGRERLAGFLARRLRLTLAQSLRVLEELSDLAYGSVDWASLENGRAQDASPDRA